MGVIERLGYTLFYCCLSVVKISTYVYLFRAVKLHMRRDGKGKIRDLIVRTTEFSQNPKIESSNKTDRNTHTHKNGNTRANPVGMTKRYFQ